MDHVEHVFVVTLTRHRSYGYLLLPFYAVQVPGEPFMRLHRRVRQHDLGDTEMLLSPEQSRIIRVAERYSDETLVRRFCPGKTAGEMPQILAKEESRKKIQTYIEGVFAELLDVLKSCGVKVYLKREKYTNLYDEDLVTLHWKDTGTIFNFERLEDETRYYLTLRIGTEQLSLAGRNIEVLVNDPCRIYYQNAIYFFNDISASKLLPFREKAFISIPGKLEERYFETFILQAVRCQEIRYSGFEVRETTPQKAAELILSKDVHDKPLFVVRFTYGGQVLKLKKGERRAAILRKTGDQFVFEAFSRDEQWESAVLTHLHSKGLCGNGDGMLPEEIISGGHEATLFACIEWLAANRTELEIPGLAVSTGGLSDSYWLGGHTLQIAAHNRIDWFDLEMTVAIGEWKFPFVRFKRLILNNTREFRLPNGEIFILPESWFAKYGEIMSLSKSDAGTIQLKPFHYTLIGGQFLDGNPEMQKRIADLSGSVAVTCEVPGNLRATLRNYQLDGFRWMHHLSACQLNGCLADDMGLGKTLQTIVLLLKLKRKEMSALQAPGRPDGQLSLFDQPETKKVSHQPASLIVLPVSLLHNWESEIRKFAPSLKVYAYSGVKRHDRYDLNRLVHHCDLILTTYGTVRNDCEVLARHTFFYLILDESQNIKNAESKSYQAVTALKAIHRLSLTGTPIENSLSDLWSQMNFLNPGLLGSQKFFRETFVLPIEKEQKEESAQRLRKLIAPFILRRTKEQVEQDLPPVTEESLSIEMTHGQSVLYDSEKSAVRNYLLKNIDDLEPRRAAFVVLQALTRLRQIAIHPKMVDPSSDIESGKFNEILSMIETLVSENHKILVFSSFVKHLNLVASACEAMNWGFCRLTGQTKDRKSVIDEFQQRPDRNIFLISLKAGGVGLNLTAADYIFIIDPWWNPAAEMQAISRAHRIGQEKKVFVYRFISENSIEEKIQALQEKKSSLAEEFIRGTDPLAGFTRDELVGLFD